MIKALFKGLKEGFYEFGKNISSIVNFILFLFAYFVGIGLTWIIAKIAGKKFLETRISKKKTYWKKLDTKEKLEDYYRQF
jgi:hypothetical protein